MFDEWYSLSQQTHPALAEKGQATTTTNPSTRPDITLDENELEQVAGGLTDRASSGVTHKVQNDLAVSQVS